MLRQEPRHTLLKKLTENALVLTSALSHLECQAGIAALSDDHRIIAEQHMNQLIAGFSLLPIHTEVLDAGRSLLRRYRKSHGLRSLDAIQGATAQLLKEDLAQEPESAHLLFLTCDQRQFAAAAAEGIMAKLVA